jgi:hypothetical protein
MVASNFNQNTVFFDGNDALAGLQEGLSANYRKSIAAKAFNAFAKVWIVIRCYLLCLNML